MRHHLLRSFVASPRSFALALSFGAAAASLAVACGDDTTASGGAGGEAVTSSTHSVSSTHATGSTVSSSTTATSSTHSSSATTTTTTTSTSSSTASSTSSSSSTGNGGGGAGPTGEVDCADGVDDDGDGMIDCADADCAASIECGTVVVNEVDYDQPNADTDEFVEIYNKGASSVNLDGVSIELIDGSGLDSYDSVDLSGNTLAAGQYLVVGSTTVTAASGAIKIDFAGATNNIQNGPDGVALYDSRSHKVIDALSYEGSVNGVTIDGNTFDLVDGTVTAAAETNSAPNRSMARFPNGTDTHNDSVDWITTDTVTPGAANTFASAEICNDGIDNNANGQIDCAEASCASMACNTHGSLCMSGACTCPGGATETSCGNGTDDDCDGLVDCADPDCAGSLMCSEICTDGTDNNGNGLVDCADPICLSQTCGANGLMCVGTTCMCPGGATTETSCTDGNDNDCDGLVDCADPSCSADPACVSTGTLVISQVYGGGGNSGAVLKYDYIELFNRGAGPATLNGHSVQYAATGSSTWAAVALPNVSIPAGGHYLVQLAAGTSMTSVDLPVTADFVVTMPNMSGSNGKVALVSSITPLTCGTMPGSCAAAGGVVDMVGYGTASDFEGSAAAPGLATNTVDVRAAAGCQDTNQNGADFAIQTWMTGPTGVTLHNASSAVAVCP